MREPAPCSSASRGRIPPEPPTAVGLMERPEWGLPREQPRARWWAWLLVALTFIAALIIGGGRRWTRGRYYGRVPLNLPEDPAWPR